jgi:uncharacterized protein
MIRPQNCPICRKVVVPVDEPARYFPFCSERCRQIDLLRWSKGQYAIVEPLTPEQLLEEADRAELDEEAGDLPAE